MVLDERLARFLKDAKGWEKKATNIPGIFLLRLLRLKIAAREKSVAIEINPINPVISLSYKEKRGSNEV
jgi:hypothetical protein